MFTNYEDMKGNTTQNEEFGVVWGGECPKDPRSLAV